MSKFGTPIAWLLSLIKRTKQQVPGTNNPQAVTIECTEEQKALELINQGKHQEAEVIYREMIANGKSSHVIYANLSALCGIQGRPDECIQLLEQALKLGPLYPYAHFNLGVALQEKGELKSAINSYKTAIKLKPNYPEAYNNIGNALKDQGDPIAAIESYRAAIQLKSNYPEAYNNLALTLQGQGDLIGAAEYYRKAIKLQPHYPEAHWNFSLTMLLGGDYKNGWEKYEWRTKNSKNAVLPHAIPMCGQWNNENTLKETLQLLLVSEQGLGDTLQFMRYAIALRNEGVSVSLCAQTKLHSLIQASGIDPSPLTPKQAKKITEGKWIPLLSVPRLLKVSPRRPIISKPYIKTTEELTRKWRRILGATERPVIGINWQGDPKTEIAGLQGRSLALEAFAPITRGNPISLVSLQKGYGSDQLETCTFKDRFVSCQDQISETLDFLETAAIIANCDLVITSDTSVAHLAGGMGKVTWLLLKKVPEWRWGLEGDTTFWYPSMRLFRQIEPGNWNELMKRVAEALEKHLWS